MKKTIIALLVAATGVLFFARWRRHGTGKRLDSAMVNGGNPPSVAQTKEHAMRRYVMYFLLPMWVIPGALDHLWHRRTKIETTSGLEESLIHSLMMAEIGIPILLGLLFEINAGLIALMIAAYLVHEATAIWDVSVAVERRKVLPREQHTHSFLEMLPFCAVSFVICLNWEQFRALFGQGPERPRFALRLKQPPLEWKYLVRILSTIGLFVGLPYGEELLRCWKAQREKSSGLDTPGAARALPTTSR
jgi:hypothetical protein